ncbi:MAG: PH domain-containing protein [Dehalococcoidia bacterium]
MYYQPPRSLGLLVGAALTAWALVLAVVLLGVGAGQGLNVVTAAALAGSVLALGVACLLGYWIYSLITLSYALDRNGLVIYWGTMRQVIPLDAIERLVPGSSVGVPRVSGVSWPGYHVGRAQIGRIGEVLFYSTHQTPEQVLYVMTTEKSYAISVTDPASFARQIQVRQDLGPTARVTHHVERVYPSMQGFATDHLGWALAAGAAVCCVAVWMVLAWQYGEIPASIPVHFPLGEALPFAETNPKSVLLHVPRAATAVLAVNLVAGVLLYGWDRAVARLLLAATIALQAGFIVALQTTIARA